MALCGCLKTNLGRFLMLITFVRIIIHDWKSFDIYFLGEISWSLWSQTYYSHWDILSVSFFTLFIRVKMYWFFLSTDFLSVGFLTLFRIIFNTLFGLSTSFWLAISVRFLLGCFNCLLGVIRVCLSFVKEYTTIYLSILSDCSRFEQMIRFCFLLCHVSGICFRSR